MKFLEPKKYQPLVRRLFKNLSTKIQTKLPRAQIEHIGSSSIKGAVSKGDLDIYVGVEPEEFKEAIRLIQSLGFNIKKNTLKTKSLCPFYTSKYKIEVGVQLVAKGSKFEFFLEFRDKLNSEKKLRDEYNQLKIVSSGLKHSEYRKIKAKFIKKVLR